MSAADYYNHTTFPLANSAGSSQAMRNEFESIESGFGKLPDLLLANAGQLVTIKTDGSGMEALATLPDNTAYNVSTLAHGFAPKLSGSATTFLRGDGVYGPAPTASTLVVDRSTNTILVGGNSSNLINFTAGFTQTVTAAATLGNGWYVLLKNSSAADVTIDPNGSETINGALTLVLRPGDAAELVCDGANFRAVLSSGNVGRVLLVSTTPTAAAAMNFLSLFTAAYDSYEIVLTAVSPATGTASLQLRYAVGGVAVTTSVYLTTTITAGAQAATTAFATVSGTVVSGGGSPNGGLSGSFQLHNVNDATTYTKAGMGTTVSVSSGAPTTITPSACYWTYNEANALSGFTLFWSNAANFLATGRIQIFGIRKSL